MRSFGALTRRNRLALVAGLSAFLVLAGTGVATAVWSAATSVTGSVTAAVTSLSISGSPSLTTTYAFAGTAAQSPTIVRSMLVTNTGSAPLNYSLAVSGVAGNTLAPLVTVTLWTISTGVCSALGSLGATTGTLAAPPALPSGALSASPGGKYTLCVATSLNSTVFDSQGRSVTPTITITGTVGSSWSSSASDAAFTQSVYQISNPTTLTCTTASNSKSVTLSWTAPAATGSMANVTYQVSEASGVLVPFQSGLSSGPIVSNSTGTSRTLLLQAKEDLYGTTSVGISITLLQGGSGQSDKISCP